MKRHDVETSRRVVSNHVSPQDNTSTHQTNFGPTRRSAQSDSDTSKPNRTANETFHRNVSTDEPHSPTKFRDRYRIKSTRLPGWDYTSAAFYFVTICTFNQEPTLGHIRDGRVLLSDAGQIADEEWRNTTVVRPNILLDEHIVMPNHIHGVLAIQRRAGVETSRRDVSNHTPRTRTAAPNKQRATPRLQSGSLGAIIGQFKSICTKRIRQAALSDFSWQTRFYDHVIRDDESLNRIRQYISENPLKWELQKGIPENLWM